MKNQSLKETRSFSVYILQISLAIFFFIACCLYGKWQLEKAAENRNPTTQKEWGHALKEAAQEYNFRKKASEGRWEIGQ